ncbi:MAG: InlB B-repeat-containing protein, partial [Clostridia bacterium]|nr:InlB B-repeat-containing protein [Clostridia bacterium]
MKRKLQLISILTLIVSIFALILVGCFGSGNSKAKQYTVSFDSMGGTAVASRLVDEGMTLVEPTEPTRDDYLFAGWYKEKGCVNAWQFATDTVTGSMTLYARWEETDVKISSINGGEIDGENITIIVA